VVVWAGDQERAWAEEIVASAAGHAVLAPSTTLTHLAALARRARLFVGSDTGPLHLAAAVGTPCVGLYGPVSAARNGPYGPHHIAIQNLLTPRDDPRRRTDNCKAMLAIAVDDVCHACDQILGRRQQAA
jgi:ADP-heptose:LPS heptosyltransferase